MIMSTRITKSMVEDILGCLILDLPSVPHSYMTKNKYNPGFIYLDKSYGRWYVKMIINEKGTTEDILSSNTLRGMYEGIVSVHKGVLLSKWRV